MSRNRLTGVGGGVELKVLRVVWLLLRLVVELRHLVFFFFGGVFSCLRGGGGRKGKKKIK